MTNSFKNFNKRYVHESAKLASGLGDFNLTQMRVFDLMTSSFSPVESDKSVYQISFDEIRKYLNVSSKKVNNEVINDVIEMLTCSFIDLDSNTNKIDFIPIFSSINVDRENKKVYYSFSSKFIPYLIYR